MNRRTLKDSHFHIIGYIETKSDGTEVAKDVRVIVRLQVARGVYSDAINASGLIPAGYFGLGLGL